MQSLNPIDMIFLWISYDGHIGHGPKKDELQAHSPTLSAETTYLLTDTRGTIFTFGTVNKGGIFGIEAMETLRVFVYKGTVDIMDVRKTKRGISISSKGRKKEKEIIRKKRRERIGKAAAMDRGSYSRRKGTG